MINKEFCSAIKLKAFFLKKKIIQCYQYHQTSKALIANDGFSVGLFLQQFIFGAQYLDADEIQSGLKTASCIRWLPNKPRLYYLWFKLKACPWHLRGGGRELCATPKTQTLIAHKDYSNILGIVLSFTDMAHFRTQLKYLMQCFISVCKLSELTEMHTQAKPGMHRHSVAFNQ